MNKFIKLKTFNLIGSTIDLILNKSFLLSIHVV